MSERDTAIRGVSEGHGLLAGHRAVRDQLDFVFTAEDVTYRAVAVEEDVIGYVADLHDRGEEMEVAVTYSSARTLEVLALDGGAEAAWAGVRYAGQSVCVSFNATTDSSLPLELLRRQREPHRRLISF